MALFSRRKKTDEPAPDEAPTETASDDTADAAPAEVVPDIGISVQAFRGVGAAAGPEVTLPDPAAPAATQTSSKSETAPAAPAGPPKLPLAPAEPPAQTESIPGTKDNVLLRETLAQVEAGATNEQLLGVLRQVLQGHVFLRVHGDLREQIEAGKPLAIATVRDGERHFLLAFSSGKAVQQSIQAEKNPQPTSAVAQPVMAVLKQAVSGDFTGIVFDNASAPHRAVFPREVLEKAIQQADPDVTIKSVLAQPRDENTIPTIAEALTTKNTWVAVASAGEEGKFGIAEARLADGRRFLQLFTHPLEVLALGRGDRPMPFTPQQLAKVLAGQNEIAGVFIDGAGPSLGIERAGLGAVIALADDDTETKTDAE